MYHNRIRRSIVVDMILKKTKKPRNIAGLFINEKKLFYYS